VLEQKVDSGQSGISKYGESYLEGAATKLLDQRNRKYYQVVDI
jgi:hypothetical protein